MHKKNILFILAISIIVLNLVGCNELEKKESKWTSYTGTNEVHIYDDIVNIFEIAKSNYKSMELDLVALLGEQVVAGKNYMFLAKSYENDNFVYKIVIVYNDLDGNSTITNVKNFDYTQYLNKGNNDTYEALSGGWYVYSKNKLKLDDEIQSIFDDATSTLTGMSYTPIVVLGTQNNLEKNYAILCYGRPSYGSFDDRLYLVTLNTNKIVSSSYIDLSSLLG